MGKSSGLVTHMTGFDSRIRIQSGCSAMAARRVRDPEDAGSIPATLTHSDEWRSSSKRLEQLAVDQKDAGSNPVCAARYLTWTATWFGPGRMARWSMGMTGDSQSPKPGSSPGRATTPGLGIARV